MMTSEFIERTGFEPTASEYEEIEAEYMGTDMDKDQFCKQWKKQGGAERLMRRRAYRIEELKTELVKKDKLFEERIAADTKRYRELFDKDRQQMQRMAKEIAILQQTQTDVVEKMRVETARADEAERRLAVLREAFAIITEEEF